MKTKAPIAPSSTVVSRASFQDQIDMSGFMKRASAMVVERPWAASSSAAFFAFGKPWCR